MVKYNVSINMNLQAVNSALTQAITRCMKFIFIIIITRQNITNDNIYADADDYCTHGTVPTVSPIAINS